jgi:hypothetical protein
VITLVSLGLLLGASFIANHADPVTIDLSGRRHSERTLVGAGDAAPR